MAKPLLKYVSRFKGINGRVRYRFRKRGLPSYYFLNRYGSIAFKAEYEACLAGNPPVKTERKQPLKKPGRPQADDSGTVYFVGHDSGPIKIGFSSKARIRLVALRISSPFDLKILASFEGTRADEKRMHSRFAGSRVRGEWFNRTDQLMNEIRDINRSKMSPRLLHRRQQEG